jgi:hypothetical protein
MGITDSELHIVLVCGTKHVVIVKAQESNIPQTPYNISFSVPPVIENGRL